MDASSDSASWARRDGTRSVCLTDSGFAGGTVCLTVQAAKSSKVLNALLSLEPLASARATEQNGAWSEKSTVAVAGFFEQ